MRRESQWRGGSSPRLRRHPEEALRDDTGRRFWAFTTTVPLTLLTLANLFLAWKATRPVPAWWLAAGLAALADRLSTFAYFIPQMVRLMRSADSPEACARMTLLARLNLLPLAFILLARMAALETFARVGASGR